MQRLENGMPNRIEMFRRLERQYFRDRLGTLGLQQLDGMILYLLGQGGRMRQEDLAGTIAMTAALQAADAGIIAHSAQLCVEENSSGV